jgi:aspartate carbamoyltransferase regulatory subunit
LPVPVSSGRVGGIWTKAKEFLTDLTDIEDWLEEKEIEQLRLYKATFTRNLINDLEKSETKNERDLITKVIANKLSVLHHEEFTSFAEWVNEKFNIMQDEINELKKLKNHRHRTVLGLYTEKPAW